MNEEIIIPPEDAEKICNDYGLRREQLDGFISLVNEGNTLPFIARYRKEKTGSMDDQIMSAILRKITRARNLQKKKDEYTEKISKQNKLTPEIAQAIQNAKTIVEIKDIYSPFKRTKNFSEAEVAINNGLEGLALKLLDGNTQANPSNLAKEYVKAPIKSTTQALSGAKKIVIKYVSTNPSVKKSIRDLMTHSKVHISISDSKAEPGVDYSQYKENERVVTSYKPHQVLALNRGTKNGKIKLSLEVDEEQCYDLIKEILGFNPQYEDILQKPIESAIHKFLKPKLEKEIWKEMIEKSNEASAQVFADNLKGTLMQSPVSGVVLAIDPGYRNGCKVAVLDNTGRVCDTSVIFPTPPKNDFEGSKQVLDMFIRKYKVDIIAIGNGTASRETEKFVSTVLKGHSGVSYTIVAENGASVYSVSKIAADEFPEFDNCLRSAISIGRRLQDPLAELVKIDPKSIGVGQYQHDIPENMLDDAVKEVVINAVNSVGADINKASPELLKYIAGMTPALAKKIKNYRDNNGPFHTREDLAAILPPSAYQQCAGFLRILSSDEILDRTGVHPESYNAARIMLDVLSIDPHRLPTGVPELPRLVEDFGVEKIAEICAVGVPTIRDIAVELSKPGRDIREASPRPLLRKDVMTIDDLKKGQKLQGTVRNVTDFGAFIDIGVHEDGLLHKSEMGREKVSVGDIIDVYVLSVNRKRKRISLTLLRSNL